MHREMVLQMRIGQAGLDHGHAHAGTGVRVSVVEPGLTDTHLQDHFPVHPKDAMDIKHVPTGEDIARGIRYVLQQPPHVIIPRLRMQPSEQPE
jgi:NADP-dependent 3-hydroxy acid dehydrogenase YdfG